MFRCTIISGLLLAAFAITIPPVAAEDVRCPEPVPDGRTIVPDRCLPLVLRSPLPFEVSRVYFASGSAELDGAAREILGRQARILAQHPQVLVDVYGHADPVEAGSDDAAVALGLARSRAVMDDLIARGVAAERIVAKSRGFRPFIVRAAAEPALSGMRFASTETRDAP